MGVLVYRSAYADRAHAHLRASGLGHHVLALEADRVPRHGLYLLLERVVPEGQRHAVRLEDLLLDEVLHVVLLVDAVLKYMPPVMRKSIKEKAPKEE